jgi:hypothetical protein
MSTELQQKGNSKSMLHFHLLFLGDRFRHKVLQACAVFDVSEVSSLIYWFRCKLQKHITFEPSRLNLTLASFSAGCKLLLVLGLGQKRATQGRPLIDRNSRIVRAGDQVLKSSFF